MIVYLQMIDTSEDRSKFEQLYLEYRGLMFHAANQILHNEQDAEDAVHQAFLSIAQHIQNIDQPISPETSCQGLFNQIHKKATKKVPGSRF